MTKAEKVTPVSNWIVGLVRDVGFPVFVALYLLLTLTPKIDGLTAAVNALVEIQKYQTIKMEMHPK